MTMARARDSQRSKFFKARKAASLGRYATQLPEMADIKAFLGKVRGKATIKRRYDAQMKWQVVLRDGRGYSRASCSPEQNWMTFPKTERTTTVVLRQYAFIITHRMNPKAAWYGWEYCSVLLDLVRFVLGSKAGDDLRIAFENNKVRYTRPAKKSVTPERKAALVEKGQKLAALNRDRRARERFAKEYPEAPIISKDAFDGDWEDIYLLWRP